MCTPVEVGLRVLAELERDELAVAVAVAILELFPSDEPFSGDEVGLPKNSVAAFETAPGWTVVVGCSSKTPGDGVNTAGVRDEEVAFSAAVSQASMLELRRSGKVDAVANRLEMINVVDIELSSDDDWLVGTVKG